MTKNSSQAIEKAVRLLKEGKLVAIPTETVYGLAADASNPEAIQKIYQAKGRPAYNPLIIHLPNIAAMSSYAVDISKTAYQLAECFWPGPLTLVLPKHPSVSSIATGGQNTVALRIPNHPVALELLRQFNGGLVAPSANRSGRISPTTREHVLDELGDKVDFILEGGVSNIGIESTIVYLQKNKARILRPGYITASEIAQFIEVENAHNVQGLQDLHDAQADDLQNLKITVPGSDNGHYAPEKPLYLLDRLALEEKAEDLIRKNKSVSVLSFTSEIKFQNKNNYIIKWIEERPEPKSFAQQLYAHLRMLDKTNCDYILVEMPPKTEAWIAVMDRLKRASVNF